MKKTAPFILFLAILLSIGNTVFAQWYADTPTPAEMKARDQPYIILQQEIKSKLCDNDWDIPLQPFLLITYHPDEKLNIRGKGIHYFSLASDGDDCLLSLKETSPLFIAIRDSTKKVVARIQENQNSGLTLSEALQRATKNGGKLTADDQKIVDQKKAVNDQCLKDLARLENAKHWADFDLQINERWTDDKTDGANICMVDDVKRLSLPGIQHAMLNVSFPDEHQPDTTYSATLYIGKWPKPDLHKMLPFQFKYNTDYAWIDKAHSGPPIIENFKILVVSHHYNNLMKGIHTIDWTKLDKLVKAD